MQEAGTYQVKNTTIDGRTYKVTVFPAGTGLELLYELKEIFGDSLGSLFGNNAEVAIARLGGSLSKAEVLDLVLRLLAFSFVEGKTQALGEKDVFNIHFAGNFGELFKVLAFVLEVNYSSFFDELKSGLVASLGSFEAMLKTAGATEGLDLSKFPKGLGHNG